MNAALIKIDVAAAELGWGAGKVFELAEGGTLLEPAFVYVFNLANEPAASRRDLRFWSTEVKARAERRTLPPLTLDKVLDRILPEKRTTFHAGEVDQLFQIRPRTRIDLHDELSGSLKQGRHFYQRGALVAFLRRRWLGSL